jgi:NADPH-ferrihemoprotein reductase
LTVAIVEFKTQINKIKKGLCSNYLKNLQVEKNEPIEKVAVWIGKGTVKFPENFTTPLIMIGPGTGCAMFHSYLEEKYFQLEQNFQVEKSNIAFFFGCRKRNVDYLYENFWNECEKKKILKIFQVSFSREFEKNQKMKNYVQNNIRLCGKQLWEMIKNGGYIIISG